jgi:heat shock protein HslJ
MVRYDYGWKIEMHTKVKSFILIVALFAALPSLQAQTPEKGKALSGLAGLQGKWYLQAVMDSDTATGKNPEINFDVTRKQFSGNTGCNTMRGNFQATDSTIAFSEQMVTTKMLCVGYNEPAFLKNLIRSNSYRIQNGKLVLMVEGTEISRWTRNVSKPKKTLKI